MHRRAVGFGHLLDEARGNPVAPHDLAHRAIALDAAQQVIFLAGEHAVLRSRSGVNLAS